MAKILENGLIEAAIVLGMDESTGLTGCKSPKAFIDNFKISNDGVMGPFQLQVLGILSGTAAIFPLAKNRVDGGSYYPRDSIYCPSMGTELTRKETLRRSMSYAATNLDAFPYSHEVIYSLATFCFPDGGFVSQREREAQILYLVLTSIEGDRSYACCLIMDRKYKTNGIRNEENEISLQVIDDTVEKESTENEEENENEAEDMVVYVPVGLCFVSRLPYFDAMRHCLSAFQEPFLKDSKSWSAFLELSSQVFRVPIPPAGPIAIEFTVAGQTCIIPSADEPDRRPDDMELHWPLLVLSADDVILVISSILTQQRIIFLSSRYSLLTLVIESFFTYIEPFKWWLTYVPVLPNKLADLIEAPGPFIMGCHSSLRKQVYQVRKLKEIPGIVLVDLDEGKVDVDDKDPVPRMPDMASQSLAMKFKRLKYLYDVEQAEKPKPRSIEEANEQRYRFKLRVAQEIKIACLDTMVSLFGDTMLLMRFSDKSFHRDNYIKSRLEDERPFFEAVGISCAFDRFIDDRLENPERRDAFAVLSERFFSSRKSMVQRNRSSSNVSTLSKKASFSIAALLSVEKEIFTLTSTHGPRAEDYFKDCVSRLTEQINSLGSRSTKVKASYYYLRGMMYMACGQPIRALEDFFSLYLVGEELFPKEYVSEILSSLNEADQQRLQEEEFYKRTADVRKYLRKKAEQKLKVASRRLPTKPLKKEEFEGRVKTLRIAHSDLSATCLFRSLTRGQEPEVTPEAFKLLYNTFFDNEKHVSSMEPSGITFEADERVLAVSMLINSSSGMGRLILTNQMLYFMAEGSRKWVVVIRVHDIKELIKFKHYVVFPPGVPALRVVNKDRESHPFFACLKEERELWVSLLNEMSIGHEAAFSYKDPKIIEIASNNVLLANVLVKMGKSLKIAEEVCTYSRSRDRDKEILSEDTRESLERRLDPSEREARKVTVMSVIYVPGRTLEESATLWCGLGPGTIIVYETASWTCVSELRCAQHRIGCLLQADDNHVWAGSYDSVIYVIDVETRTTVRRLSKHTGFICDMIKALDESNTIWSATYEGQLHQWHIESCEPVREIIQLRGVATLNKLLFAFNKIWCVTTTSIMVVSPNSGQVLETISSVNGSKSSALFQYGCTLSDDIIWIAGEDKGQLFSIHTSTHEMREVEANTSASFNSMVAAGDSVWVGCKDGKVLIIDPQSHVILRELNAHTDVIKCMCVTREGHVVTGSSSGDGKLCIWNAEEKDRYESADSLGYEVVDGRRLKCSSRQMTY